MPEVEEVFEPAVPHPEVNHRFELLGYDRLPRVGEHPWRGHVRQQYGQLRFQGRGSDSITIPNVDVQRDLCPTQVRGQGDPYSFVAFILSHQGRCNGVRVELEPIFLHGLTTDGADL